VSRRVSRENHFPFRRRTQGEEAKPVDEYEGFREFAAMNGPALLRSAYVLTGDRHRAEDLLQDVLAKLASRWHRIEPSGDSGAYARKVLYREFCSWWRVRRHHERPVAEPPDAMVDDFADRADLRVALASALLCLPPKQRALLTLRYYEDQTEAETARIMGCAVGTVKSQTHKALQRMRALLPDLTTSNSAGGRR
jgi:RNA polymerase sigma-70 factor (sigma-E family)